METKLGQHFGLKNKETSIKLLNPLTPMPAITDCDNHWLLFLFWRHHFWPKLESSVLKFCRRKRSFQWHPDQSDWLSGAWIMHKNAQKFDWKNSSKIWLKIAYDYTWLHVFHGKIYKFWFLHMPKQECRKTWKERHAVMLQMPFWLHRS